MGVRKNPRAFSLGNPSAAICFSVFPKPELSSMADGCTNSFLFCLESICLYKEKKYTLNKESPSRARNTIGQSSMWKSATSSTELSWALTGSHVSPISQRAYRHRAFRNNWYNQNNALNVTVQVPIRSPVYVTLNMSVLQPYAQQVFACWILEFFASLPRAYAGFISFTVWNVKTDISLERITLQQSPQDTDCK